MNDLLRKQYDVFKDTISYKFGFKKYEQIFQEDKNMLFGELAKHTAQNNYIFSWSNFSNKLFVLNNKSLKVVKTIIVRPNNFEIGIKKEKITGQKLLNFGSIINNKAKISGLIKRVYFDNMHNIYYITVLDKLSEKWYNKNEHRPWSLLIQNKKFEKLNEFYFKEKKHTTFTLQTRTGLLVQLKQKIENYKTQKAIFELYQYEN